MENELRSYFRRLLKKAADKENSSIEIPLMVAESFGCSKVDGLGIAQEECSAFLQNHEMDINIVARDSRAHRRFESIIPQLEEYINRRRIRTDYPVPFPGPGLGANPSAYRDAAFERSATPCQNATFGMNTQVPKASRSFMSSMPQMLQPAAKSCEYKFDDDHDDEYDDYCDEAELFDGENELEKRMKHLSDPFGKYMMFLAEEKGKSSIQIQNDAWISRKVYSKINTHQDTYHPDKRTACQICVGLGLNYDESKDLLKRAGYDFSPSEKEDLIWSFFLERDNEDYDIFDISDALEKYGLKPIVVLESKKAN